MLFIFCSWNFPRKIQTENKMKSVISVFVLMSLFSARAFANKQVDCEFSHKYLKSVVIMTGNPGSVELQFNNGDLENLRPQKGVGGEFGEIVFPDKIEDKSAPRETSFVLVKSPRMGEIKIAFICNYHGLYCDTMGDGFTLEAIAAFRINDELIKFDGYSNPLCRRTALR